MLATPLNDHIKRNPTPSASYILLNPLLFFSFSFRVRRKEKEKKSSTDNEGHR